MQWLYYSHAMIKIDKFCFPDARATPGGSFGMGGGGIYGSSVACTPTEERLVDCAYDTSTAGCSHANDAGVICSTQCELTEL